MKIRLSVSEERVEEVTDFLTSHGIELDEEAEYVLLQKDIYPGYLTGRSADGERAVISADEIITIESYGHTVEIHTARGSFTTSDRLYRLANSLDPENFIRVNNSVIVSKTQIREILPTFSMKFILVTNNGTRVDVTRSYYGKFKEFLGI